MIKPKPLNFIMLNEVTSLRDENHKLSLALKTLELNFDQLMSENSSLKSSAKEKDSIISDLKASLSSAHSKILEAKSAFSSAEQNHQLQLADLHSNLRTKEKEIALLSAKVKALQENIDNDVERIKIKHSLENKFKDEITILKSKAENLEISLSKKIAENEKLAKKYELEILKYETALKDLKMRHKKEIDELKLQTEKFELEVEDTKKRLFEKESEAKKIFGEMKVRLEFSETELKKFQQQSSFSSQEKTDTLLKYNDVLDKIKDEKRILQAEFDKIIIEKSFIENELNLKRSIFEKMEKQIGSLLRERENLGAEINRKDEQLSDFSSRLKIIEEENRSSLNLIHRKNEESSNSLKQKLDKEKSRAQEFEEIAQKLKRQMTEITEESEKMEFKLSEKCNKLTFELDKLRANLEETQAKFRDLDLEFHRTKLEKETLAKQILEKDKELERAKKLGEDGIQNAKVYLDSLGRLKKFDSLEEALQKYKSKCKSYKKKLDQANKKLVELLNEKKNFWNPSPVLFGQAPDYYQTLPNHLNNFAENYSEDYYKPKYSHFLPEEKFADGFFANHTQTIPDENNRFLNERPISNKFGGNEKIIKENYEIPAENLYFTSEDFKKSKNRPKSSNFQQNIEIDFQTKLPVKNEGNKIEIKEDLDIFVEPQKEKPLTFSQEKRELLVDPERYNSLSTEDRIRELIINGDRLFKIN